MDESRVHAAVNLVAKPNPVPYGAELGTTTITWSTGDGSPGEIYLSIDGGSEQLFAVGPQGSQEAAWIIAGHKYEFRLYAGMDRKLLLTTVTVTQSDERDLTPKKLIGRVSNRSSLWSHKEGYGQGPALQETLPSLPDEKGYLTQNSIKGNIAPGLSAPRNMGGVVQKHHARLLAFYLPQFHPIPENDEWWGKGFTEWTNVSKAQPLFTGHYQPHIPANLGFYDLRVPEARQAQANLARAYGIEGFCYWHYWFEGKRLLERPFNEVLSSGQPDFPFCLAWANETWSRRWLGEEKEVLQKQIYSFEDDLHHVRWLLTAFSDPRYIRINGRPVFLVYKPFDLPDPWRTMEIFRSECLKNGLAEPYLLGINAHRNSDCRAIGFDGNIDFEPQLGVVPGALEDGLKIYDYALARLRMTNRQRDFPYYPSIFVQWDNTPRRGENGVVFINATPENFENGLRDIVQSTLDKPFEDRLIFVNAWNEWAEGNHLEPDLKHGLAYLEAVKRVNLLGRT